MGHKPNPNRKSARLTTPPVPSKSDENWKAIRNTNVGQRMFDLHQLSKQVVKPKGRPRKTDVDPKMANPFFVPLPKEVKKVKPSTPQRSKKK
jgi:hypothetical protein